MTGRIIAVEGLDGCGKSTLIAHLAARLGARTLATPDAGLIAARAAVHDAWHHAPSAVRLFYAASVIAQGARAHQWAGAGHLVLVDRYWASTLAYAALDPDPPDLLALEDQVRPVDLTLYLDAPDPERERRMRGRGPLTEHDLAGLRSASRVREAYQAALRRPPHGRVIPLNAALDLETLCRTAVHAIDLVRPARALPPLLSLSPLT